MAYKVFVAGEEALAADANSYLMSQTVSRFTNATQRTSQLTAPVLNQLSVLDSRPGVVEYWTGTAWTDIVPYLPQTYMRVYRAAGLQTPAGVGTVTNIAFDQKTTADPSNLYNTTTGEYTVPVNGIYAFHANLTFGVANNPSDWTVLLAANGAEYQRGSQFKNIGGSAGDNWGFLLSSASYFVAGTKLMIKFASGGGNPVVMVTSAPSLNTFTIYRINTV